MLSETQEPRCGTV